MTTRTLTALLIAILSLAAGCTRHEAPKVVADDTTMPSPALSLPHVKSGAALMPSRFTIALDAKNLLLDGALIVPRAADPTHGFDAQYKRSGEADLYLVPLGAALDHARGGKDAGPADAARLDFSGDVTYRELVEIAFTLGQNEVRAFRFVAPSAGGLVPQGTLAQIEIFPPHAGSPPEPDKSPKLNPVLLLIHDGISVKARGGNVAPGCSDLGTGLALPKGDAGYPFGDLTSCLTRLKAAAPEFADETSVVLSANPDARYRDVLVAIDTARGAHHELFPDVQLGIAK